MKKSKKVLQISLLSICVAAMFFASSCRKEQLTSKETEQLPGNYDDQALLQKVIAMGFRADMIEDLGEAFLVEGDIAIVKEELRQGNYDFDQDAADYSDDECAEGHDCEEGAASRQARRSSLISGLELRTITVRVDGSIPSSGVDNWRTEVQQAVNDWNTTQSAVRMVYTTGSVADITVRSDAGALSNGTIADASWPSGGKPGNRIRINLDFFSNQSVPTGRKRYNMVHELGHCLGFRHTNWSARGESSAIQIGGTPATDGNSVMNGGTALNTWSGFSTWDIIAVRNIYPSRYIAGVGSAGEGASIEVGNIGGFSSQPDAILMAYDAPSGPNQFRYRVAYDLGDNGVARSVGPTRYVSGVGNAGDGAGIALGNIGGNSRPDIVLMAYDDPSGGNTFRYKVGYDLSMAGQATSWSSTKYVTGVGSAGDGADIAIGNFGGTSRPDIIFMAYDDPSGGNTFRYKIGYDLTAAGNVSFWSTVKYISGMGSEGEGAGISIANIGGSSRPDIVLMAYDAPSGANQFRYKIGYDLNTSGTASSWSSTKYVGGVGWVGDGAGAAFYNVGGNARPELLLMAYDDPAGGNTFRYRVGYDINAFGNATHW